MHIWVDGFPVADDDPLRALQITLSDWLTEVWVMEGRRVQGMYGRGNIPTNLRDRVRKLPPVERIEILRACYASVDT